MNPKRRLIKIDAMTAHIYTLMKNLSYEVEMLSKEWMAAAENEPAPCHFCGLVEKME